MKIRTLAAAILVLAAVTVTAQPKFAIDYRPISGIRAGELPVLQMTITGQGELRGESDARTATVTLSLARRHVSPRVAEQEPETAERSSV